MVTINYYVVYKAHLNKCAVQNYKLHLHVLNFHKLKIQSYSLNLYCKYRYHLHVLCCGYIWELKYVCI